MQDFVGIGDATLRDAVVSIAFPIHADTNDVSTYIDAGSRATAVRDLGRGRAQPSTLALDGTPGLRRAESRALNRRMDSSLSLAQFGLMVRSLRRA